jgi:membrane protease YdiL (CAAX protease family)
MLAGYVITGALAEELLWRQPLTYPLPRRIRLAMAAISGSGFVLAHLPRDGREAAAIHTINTSSWTAAAIAGRSIRWPMISHCVYNWLSLTVAPPKLLPQEKGPAPR